MEEEDICGKSMSKSFNRMDILYYTSSFLLLWKLAGKVNNGLMDTHRKYFIRNKNRMRQPIWYNHLYQCDDDVLNQWFTTFNPSFHLFKNFDGNFSIFVHSYLSIFFHNFVNLGQKFKNSHQWLWFSTESQHAVAPSLRISFLGWWRTNGNWTNEFIPLWLCSDEIIT